MYPSTKASKFYNICYACLSNILVLKSRMRMLLIYTTHELDFCLLLLASLVSLFELAKDPLTTMVLSLP